MTEQGFEQAIEQSADGNMSFLLVALYFIYRTVV